MGHVRRKDTSEMVPFGRRAFGHVNVSIYIDAQGRKSFRSKRMVARLVANAFVDGYTGIYDAVKHLNGNRLDNRAVNLKWVPRFMLSSAVEGACGVMVSLVDDPEVQMVFSSISQAQDELHVEKLKKLLSVHGKYATVVDWNGERKLVLIQLLFPEN
ncbi:hypothetical protein BJV82DRAFT_605278 [Fennellomyces sp. T-0311]|nr:hypothetical protein BJV82DRAFT_605278 [Fennellomyces sp. T-0311]